MPNPQTPQADNSKPRVVQVTLADAVHHLLRRLVVDERRPARLVIEDALRVYAEAKSHP